MFVMQADVFEVPDLKRNALACHSVWGFGPFVFYQLTNLCFHDLSAVISLLTQNVLASCELKTVLVARVIAGDYIRRSTSS